MDLKLFGKLLLINKTNITKGAIKMEEQKILEKVESVGTKLIDKVSEHPFKSAIIGFIIVKVIQWVKKEITK